MLGRLPVVPRQPPPLLPGATADRAFKVFLLKLVVAVCAVLVLVELVQLPEWPTAVTSLLVLGLGVTALVLALRWWQEVGERALTEIEAGYTTMVLTFGLLRSRPHRRWWQTAWRVPWDYRGIWVLRGDGSVSSAPDRSVLPPGWYPSPHRQAERELWTGAAWSNQYEGG